MCAGELDGEGLGWAVESAGGAAGGWYGAGLCATAGLAVAGVLAGAVVSVATGDGFWLALVENTRGKIHATATRARIAVAAPRPIQSPR